MITINQAEIRKQIEAVPVGFVVENSLKADNFLKTFEASLRRPYYASRGQAKTENLGADSLKAAKKGDERITAFDSQRGRLERTEHQSRKYDKQQGMAVREDPECGNNNSSRIRVEENVTEPEKMESNPERIRDEEETNSDSAALVLHSEKLLAVMDDIVALLQYAALAAEENDNNDVDGLQDNTWQNLSSSVRQGIEQCLNELVETAEKLEGTKTAGLAMGFVKKLMQLLDKDSYEVFLQDQVQISAENMKLPEAIVGKMLSEAETAKMNLVTQSIAEILIPAMEVKGEAAPLDEALVQGEEPETNVQGKEGILFANTEEQGQLESGIRHKADSGEFASSEEALKQENMHFMLHSASDATTDISPLPNQETAFTEPVRAQAYTGPEVTRQIIEKAETMIREDKTEMIMQLKPDSLGKISLKIIHERGEIIAKFAAENEQVKAVLENNMQLLRDSLQKSGITVQTLEVSVGQQGQQQQEGWDRRQAEKTGYYQVLPGINPEKAEKPVYLYGNSGMDDFRNGESKINLTA